MFRKLLVPLDRSSLAEEAIGQAASVARESGASIDLVLVHEPFPVRRFADLPWEGDSSAEQKYLESIAAELGSGAHVTATCAVLRGAPGDMIGRRARDIGADLIVMTSHGRTGFSRTWLGSVADAVMRKSAIPVLMLRPEQGTTNRRTAAHGIETDSRGRWMDRRWPSGSSRRLWISRARRAPRSCCFGSFPSSRS